MGEDVAACSCELLRVAAALLRWSAHASKRASDTRGGCQTLGTQRGGRWRGRRLWGEAGNVQQPPERSHGRAIACDTLQPRAAHAIHSAAGAARCALRACCSRARGRVAHCVIGAHSNVLSLLECHAEAWPDGMGDLCWFLQGLRSLARLNFASFLFKAARPTAVHYSRRDSNPQSPP